MQVSGVRSLQEGAAAEELTLEIEEIPKSNKAAQDYRYLYRFNVIPFDTGINRTPDRSKWSEHQDGVTEEQHKEWIANNAFNKGIATILGKARDKDGFEDCFVFAIDLDGQSAIDEFCTGEDGSKTTFEELSKMFIVEQHADDPTSCHIIGYSSKQLKNRSVVTKPNRDPTLREKIEVKADSGHLINISPSIHKNGTQWVTIGEDKVPDIDKKGQMEKHLVDVFKRNGANYLSETTKTATAVSREEKHETQKTIEAELIAIYHFKSLKDTDEIYYYDNEKGVYIKDAEWLIKQECMKYDPECKTSNVKLSTISFGIIIEIGNNWTLG